MGINDAKKDYWIEAVRDAFEDVDHNFRFLITLWIVIGMYARGVFPLHQIIKKVLND